MFEYQDKELDNFKIYININQSKCLNVVICW